MGATRLVESFDRRTLTGVLLRDLDAQFDRLLTSPSRDLFVDPPESVRILVLGGVAMMAYRSDRRTTDVDSVTKLHEALTVAARTVATTHGLRRDWLNDETIGSEPPLPPPHTDPIFQGKRITVVQPGPAYLLATKIVAGRQRDIEDAATLMATTGHTSVDSLCDLVTEVYGTADPRPGTNVPANATQALLHYLAQQQRGHRRSQDMPDIGW